MTEPTDPARPITTVADALEALRAACAFLTVLPISPGATDRDHGFLARAMAMFPAVGAGIGGLAAIVLLLAGRLGFDSFVAAVLALATMVLITGALHEDGLADLADGLGGGRTVDDKLRIMRDSRIGTFGVLALVFAVLLRVGALATLPGTNTAAAAVIAAGALSRAPMVAMACWLPKARTTGLAATAGRPTRSHVVIASGTAIAVAVIALGPGEGIAAVIAAVVGAGVVAWLAYRQIGGCTGDVFGASQQVAESMVLLAVVAVAAS